MRKLSIVLAGLSLWAGPELAATLTAQASNIGVVIVAHGSKEDEWNQAVERVVQQVRLEYPDERPGRQDAPGCGDAAGETERERDHRRAVFGFLPQ